VKEREEEEKSRHCTFPVNMYGEYFREKKLNMKSVKNISRQMQEKISAEQIQIIYPEALEKINFKNFIHHIFM
jgi:hypothetical protein